MSAERQDQIERLYRAALSRPPSERVAFVAESSGDDTELRRAVEARLTHTDATAMAHAPAGVAIGTMVGLYRVDGVLAGGGMGVVCRGTDTKLNRPVAIKFLADFVLDANARQRFQREAQLASGLNHPHILTVYDAGELDGRQYLVTEYVDGGTLADWALGEQPRSWRQCVELLIGVADALATAHDANILHRDIKPANILVSKSGYAKLADFGLAKPTDVGSGGSPQLATVTGAVIGTIAYMSPEQAAGRTLDQRSDVFSFGVVVYELLARRRPFTGNNDLALLQNIIHADPVPLGDDVPAALRTIVEKAIEKDPADRYQSMRDCVVDLRRVARAAAAHRDHSLPDVVLDTAVPNAPARKRARPSLATAAMAIVVLLGIGTGGWLWQRSVAAARARADVIPAIAQLVDAGDYVTAFARAQEVAEYVADDPLLQSLQPKFTATYSVTTVPDDATVSIRGYDADGEAWTLLGRTPLEKVEIPRRTWRWRIEKPGFETIERATTAQDDVFGFGTLNLSLGAVGTQPPEMVAVPGGVSARAVNLRALPTVELPPFLIDRTEVTNQAFKEFIAAGGYERRSYWDGINLVDERGQPLSWEGAMARFVDTTGRAGPATWELGDYPRGQAELPVTGISWYEAAAYARFRGKSLPSVFHWTKAALPATDVPSSLAASILPLSNFGSAGPAPVASYQGMGPYGTYDLFGNVSEWLSNTGPPGAWVIGGYWEDPEHQYQGAVGMPRIERSSRNGMRLMQEMSSGATAKLHEPIDLDRPRRAGAALTPISDDAFATIVGQFAYRRGELGASEPATMATTEDWVKQRVTINAGYSDERLDVILLIPTRFRPPYQALIYFGGLGDLQSSRSIDIIEPGFDAMPLDFIVKSGRVIVHPIYQGTFNRFRSPWNAAETVRTEREWIERRWDVGRTVDYLETRSDIDASRIGYLGVSFGASFALPLVATEPRLRLALLLSGGTPTQEETPTPLVDPLNFAPRITIPALMFNGAYDSVFPPPSQQLLFDALGTPAEDKRYVVLPYTHGSPPRADLLRETLGWLDNYFGRPTQ